MDFLRDFLQNGINADPIHLVPWESAYIIVLVLLLSRILHSFLFKPVLAVLDERARLLASATGSQEETGRLLDAKSREHSERLAKAWAEAGGTIDAAKREAETVRQSRLSEARSAAEGRIEQVRSRLADETRKAEAELKQSSKDLAKKMASVLLGRGVA